MQNEGFVPFAADSTCRPSGRNAACFTSDACPWNLEVSCIRPTSHTRTTQSSFAACPPPVDLRVPPAERAFLPSGENATHQIGVVCPDRSRVGRCVFMFQKRRVLLKLPERP